jgi:hypothetical protein
MMMLLPLKEDGDDALLRTYTRFSHSLSDAR